MHADARGGGDLHHIFHIAQEFSTERLRLARLCVSDANRNATISLTPAVAARSAPRALGTNPRKTVPCVRSGACEDFGRVGHLWDGTGTDKSYHLHGWETASGEPIDKSDLVRGWYQRQLNLKAVPRSDLDDGDTIGRNELHTAHPIPMPDPGGVRWTGTYSFHCMR